MSFIRALMSIIGASLELLGHLRLKVPRLELENGKLVKYKLASEGINQARLAKELFLKVSGDLSEHLSMASPPPSGRIIPSLPYSKEIGQSPSWLSTSQESWCHECTCLKRAEGEAEPKFLSGQGMARQRQAIVDGLRDDVLVFSMNVPLAQ
nr:hypothetical protein [Tanacetum cinerariifolium]